MKREIKQATVVITGASSGIGRAIALEFAKEQAYLVLAARNAENLLETAQECQRLGAKAIAVPTDTTDLEAMQELARTATETFDRGIDVWINNAGIGTVGEFATTPLESHVQVVKTNLFGYMNGCYAVLPYFKEQGHGIIINMNSLGAWLPLPYASGYSASKFGLLGFMEALRGELSDRPNIHVCDLFPITVDTPGYLHAGNYTGKTLKPVRPMIAPEEVAKHAVAVARSPRAQTSIGWPTPIARLGYSLFPKISRNFAGQMLRDYFRIGSPSPVTEGHIFESHRERGRTSDGLRAKHERPKTSGLPFKPSVTASAAALLALAFGTGLYLALRKAGPAPEAKDHDLDASVEQVKGFQRRLG
jgi:short-subunit dehydrogenase